MREIGIGLLGFGTVGAGVVDLLQRNADLLAARLGCRPVLRGIADLDVTRDRGVAVAPGLLTTDAAAVIDHPRVEIVVELIGGTTVAATLMDRALAAGRHVVTANKALLAEKGRARFSLAARHGVDLYFSASCGGGIPLVRALREGFVGNRITAVRGILNGTCNYILTRMEQEGMDFAAALAAAQREGYAEADPSLDIDGIDTAHKVAIMAAVCHDGLADFSHIRPEGIRGIAATDIRVARSLGYAIKLLGIARGNAGRVECQVHPALLPEGDLLAQVHGVFNAVAVHGDFLGESLLYGRGAGRNATASSVVGDIADICRNIVAGSVRRVPPVVNHEATLDVVPMAEVATVSYIRLMTAATPAAVAAFLAGQGLPVERAALLPAAEGAGVVVLTGPTADGVAGQAVAAAGAALATTEKPVRIRIEQQ